MAHGTSLDMPSAVGSDHDEGPQPGRPQDIATLEVLLQFRVWSLRLEESLRSLDEGRARRYEEHRKIVREEWLRSFDEDRARRRAEEQRKIVLEKDRARRAEEQRKIVAAIEEDRRQRQAK
ncbi:hypothetical protein HKX48_009192, partial [Thoreauomyces humboldtii]